MSHPEDDEIAQFWRDTRYYVGIDKVAAVIGPSATGLIPPPAWSFGDNPALADELLALVLAGRKTATTSALAEFEAEDEELPVKGDVSIILDSDGHPAALVRTTSVVTCRFDEVDADFAAAEGEGDLSLESWRREHEAYFTRVMEELGGGFDPSMTVVCERFELRYPQPHHPASTTEREPEPYE